MNHISQDEASEMRIRALQDVLNEATDPQLQRKAHDAMVAEINERSPAQVARMERERGL